MMASHNSCSRGPAAPHGRSRGTDRQKPEDAVEGTLSPSGPRWPRGESQGSGQSETVSRGPGAGICGRLTEPTAKLAAQPRPTPVTAVMGALPNAERRSHCVGAHRHQCLWMKTIQKSQTLNGEEFGEYLN
uniref:Uncharacterized protein n=1 Tax=Molossus molossus TaxID=27622 RepID=A0A7J8EF84_MOLMO|nr:hypothetical protein HJG59_008882 [Molossus molossus]